MYPSAHGDHLILQPSHPIAQVQLQKQDHHLQCWRFVVIFFFIQTSFYFYSIYLLWMTTWIAPFLMSLLMNNDNQCIQFNSIQIDKIKRRKQLHCSSWAFSATWSEFIKSQSCGPPWPNNGKMPSSSSPGAPPPSLECRWWIPIEAIAFEMRVLLLLTVMFSLEHWADWGFPLVLMVYKDNDGQKSSTRQKLVHLKFKLKRNKTPTAFSYYSDMLRYLALVSLLII